VKPVKELLWTRKHSKRWLRLKLAITCVFIITIAIDSWIGTHIALAGNLFWLWVDFENGGNNA
jgi:hypothetical protein